MNICVTLIYCRVGSEDDNKIAKYIKQAM